MKNEKASIPAQELLFNGPGDFPASVMLLLGPPGSGKTLYSMQFLREGISNRFDCAYISCSPGLSPEEFNSYFIKKGNEPGRVPSYFNPFSPNSTGEIRTNNASQRPKDNAISSISDFLRVCTALISANHRKPSPQPTYVVVDSLTNLAARFSIDEVNKFVAGLYDFVKVSGHVTVLLTYTGSPSTDAVDVLGSLVDGVIQLRMEDSGEDIERSIRILSLKGSHNTPRWVKFRIQSDGTLSFGQENPLSEGDSRCKLCDSVIIGPVSRESGSSFHPHCLDTYRKLGEIYGSHSMYALQPGVVNGNFFFIDIVGLSDPLLSVEKQIRKIEDLNALIGACDAFGKVPKDAKIVLPTGDGMVIGFLVNPELPLQLSMQLHQRLRAFNEKQTSDRTIGVRIGLSSGPVFVVSDINKNQNVWGPGIILARRVMDLGDNGHILLADNIAETLTNLKDEYRTVIKLVSTEYRIKHGQLLRLYSAYSHEFGNAAKPTRIVDFA
jgi:KaiC/GvpD/RAD55 family RecA-like ATPase/class 3 adenylate cyclase